MDTDGRKKKQQQINERTNIKEKHEKCYFHYEKN